MGFFDWLFGQPKPEYPIIPSMMAQTYKDTILKGKLPSIATNDIYLVLFQWNIGGHSFYETIVDRNGIIVILFQSTQSPVTFCIGTDSIHNARRLFAAELNTARTG